MPQKEQEAPAGRSQEAGARGGGPGAGGPGGQGARSPGRLLGAGAADSGGQVTVKVRLMLMISCYRPELGPWLAPKEPGPAAEAGGQEPEAGPQVRNVNVVVDET